MEGCTFGTLASVLLKPHPMGANHSVVRDLNMNSMPTTNLAAARTSTLNRRTFLQRAVKGASLTALLSGLPKGWLGSVYASDAPETAALNFGMIALTDCSPIVIAHEKGLFKKQKMNKMCNTHHV